MADSRDELADAIERAEGVEPGVIDSKRLLDESDSDAINFGRVWSNNRHRDRAVGLVAGATYFGDEWVEARAAYCGETIDIRHEAGEPAYCEQDIGQDLLDYMTTTWVEQAATRFGRDDDVDDVRVYVDTREVPDGFPVVDASDEMVRTTETQREVYDAVAGGAETIAEVEEEVDVTRRHVSNVAWALENLGLLSIDRLALEYGQHRLSPSGSSPISINTVELPEITQGVQLSGPRADVDVTPTGPTGAETVQSSLERYEDPAD